MLSCAHTYPSHMNKSNNTQTLFVGLSFLVLGLIIGLLVSNGALTPQGPSEETTVQSAADQVDPDQLETVSVSEDNDPSLGSADAPVTIVEFSDYQCPFCRSFVNETMPSLLEDYIDQGIVRVVFRDFPLPSHPQASLAAQSAECVRAKTTEDADTAYFAMHDLLFENQSAWSGKTDAKETMVNLALENLNVDIQSCLDSEEMKAEVEADYVAGKSYGISGTPSFFINGKKLVGAWPYEVFVKVIEAVL